jgi:hypothetical protein
VITQTGGDQVNIAATGGTSSADRGSIIGGYWDTKQYWGTSATTGPITGVANLSNATLVYFPAITVNTVLFQVTVTCSACNARFAVYSTDKTTRIWDSGVITDVTSPGLGTTGLKTLTVTQVTIPEGWAYLVWATDSTSLEMVTSYQSGSYSLGLNIMYALGAPAAGYGATNASGSPYNLPTSLGTIVAIDSSRIPEFIFQKR